MVAWVVTGLGDAVVGELSTAVVSADGACVEIDSGTALDDGVSVPSDSDEDPQADTINKMTMDTVDIRLIIAENRSF